MKLAFTKMQGLGNDFVVLDELGGPLGLDREQMRFIADRHFGIGCDQILMVAPAQQAGVDFTYRIFNADGSEVEQCGNGARCFAVYVRSKGMTDKDRIRVATLSGVITLQIENDGQVTVDMGVPVFDPSALPFLADGPADTYPIDVAGKQVAISAVSIGNPHAVIQVDDVATAPVEEWGPLVESHALFPNRVNVGFMQIVSEQAIRLRVYERGSGETLACGTGACAAVVVGRQRGQLAENVKVSLPGGDLQVYWRGEGQPVMMTGPATTVFEGHIEL